MKLRYLWLLLVVAGLGFPQARADTSLCENFAPEPAHFRDLYRKGVELGRAICLTFGDKTIPAGLEADFVEFAELAGQASARAFAATDFAADMQRQMQHLSAIARQGVNKADLPSFITVADNQDFNAVFFGFDNLDEMGEARLDDSGCQQSGGADCAALFESLHTAIEQYKLPFVNLSGADLSARAETLLEEWDRYFEQARAQTLLDALLTTAMAQDHLARSTLVGPMERQWFVIHPSIVIENISEAENGDELAEALAIEWIGINWWDADSSPIGYPFGVSLASVYSDRAEVEEVGHGLMFHFGNSLSIGWTDHDGDDGWSVTLDVLGLMARKKQHWKGYQAELEKIIEAYE